METVRPLEGHVAFVTGASSGLGRATAIELARAGSNLALLARSEAELERLAIELEREDVRALPLAVDLADADAVLAAADGALDELGRVDLLVNSAATDVPGPLEQLTPEDWDRVLAVNLRAPFLLSRAVFPRLRDLPGRNGDELGRLERGGSKRSEPRARAPEPRAAPRRCRRAHRLDRVSATRAR